jgi:hypothetical protein
MGYVRETTWPEAHSRLLRHIQTLGRKSDAEYLADFMIDSIEKPWVAENKHRARELVEHAEKLSNEGRNEAGWRLWVEGFVLYRFTVEVTW